jgi:hypothetical protein
VAILLATALACAALATRTARRYGFDRRTRRAWQWTAFLLGPAGLVTLWFLHDWPAREQCRSCGARRPVTLDACPFCRQPAPSPVPNGTEILVGIAIGRVSETQVGPACRAGPRVHCRLPIPGPARQAGPTYRLTSPSF